MAQPIDILDERDPLGFPFVGSLFVHAAVVALLFTGWYWMKQARETLGEPNPGGGPAYSVSPVHSIPIPQQHGAAESSGQRYAVHRSLSARKARSAKAATGA